jgi:hypothetical protein
MVDMKTETETRTRYIRLSETVLFRVPDCYGQAPIPDACPRCPIRKWCSDKQEVIWR